MTLANIKKSLNNVFALKSVIHLVSLGLLTNLYYLAITDQLGGDPVEEVLHFTGMGALNLLLLSLTVTPVVQRFKWHWLLKVRRLVGLYSFTYILCHMLSFLAFEVQFDGSLFIDEIVERPYITVGMAGFVLLFLLAITSISAIKRSMGKRWQQLHYWVYLAAILATIHFYWSVKSEIIEPSVYFVIVVVLLSSKKQKILRWLKGH